jgi:hypothetical protein
MVAVACRYKTDFVIRAPHKAKTKRNRGTIAETSSPTEYRLMNNELPTRAYGKTLPILKANSSKRYQ